MGFQSGIDKLLSDQALTDRLKKCRVGLIAHPASITGKGEHSLDALIKAGCNIVRVFGPQHGMRGDKQDNMIESSDYSDPHHKIPIISLYGKHRYPTEEMLSDLDIVLFDLQDIGCRIYTYITTLYYFCEACPQSGSELWVLDRPNPAGRPIDGLFLEAGEESFVGCASLPTRHGMTVGELATYFKVLTKNELDLQIIKMVDYQPSEPPGFGWPLLARPWINPSPNAASLNMARCFAGTVLLEGTTLSEGRGTTTPLEVIGAPDWPIHEVINELEREAPHVFAGALIRSTFFSPTFHKHAGRLCSGIQMHTDYPDYQHSLFKPFRLIASLLKTTRQLLPDYELWRFHEYEYELDRTPIDVINGGPWLRTWIDDNEESYDTLDRELIKTASAWEAQRAPYLMYP